MGLFLWFGLIRRTDTIWKFDEKPLLDAICTALRGFLCVFRPQNVKNRAGRLPGARFGRVL
jgi:hypothetical protein